MSAARTLSVAMPTVWTDRHRGHTTNGGYWLGVHIAGDEEPERGDELRAHLAAAGSPIVDAPDLGLAPVLAVHDERFVDCLRRAYPQWVAAGATLNVPMPAGTGDDQWLEALAKVAAAVRAHGSEALVVSLGVDAAADDPNSPLQITSSGFRDAGRLLGELHMPTVFVQEGGYNLGQFASLVCEVLHGFEERNG